jgi:hypothetical protein
LTAEAFKESEGKLYDAASDDAPELKLYVHMLVSFVLVVTHEIPCDRATVTIIQKQKTNK